MISRGILGLLAYVGVVAADFVNKTVPATSAPQVYGKTSPQPYPTEISPPAPSPNGPSPEWGDNWYRTKTVTQVTTCYVTIDHTLPPIRTTIYMTSTEDIYLTNTTTTTTTQVVPTTVVSTYTTVTSYPFTVIEDHTSFRYSTVTSYSTYTTNFTITDHETSTTSIPYPTTVVSLVTTSIPYTVDHSTTLYSTTVLTSTVVVVSPSPTTVISIQPTTSTTSIPYPTTVVSLVTTSVPYTVDHSTTLYSTTVLTSTVVVVSPSPTTVISIQPTTTTTVTTLFFTTVSIVPASTVTSTIQGTPITVIVPASTITVTSTTVSTQLVPTTLPGQIITLPGSPGQITTIPGPTQTITESGNTVTKTITQATVCPAPTKEANVVAQDTGIDALWGCTPGFVCFLPFPDHCNLWAEPPTFDYVCPAQYCKPAPKLPQVTWPENKTDYFPPTDGYFNLNPNAFGLTYDIFVTKIIVEWVTIYGTKTHITRTFTEAWASQTSITHFPPTPTPSPKVKPRDSVVRTLLKRDSTIIPAVCFARCNSCFLEAQHVGKSPALCDAGSLFKQQLALCDQCATIHAVGQDALRVYADPEFKPFLDYCGAIAALPVLQSITNTVIPEPVTVIASTETLATPSVTVTPQAPASTNAPTVPISSEVATSTGATSSGTASGGATSGGAPTTTAPVPGSTTSGGPKPTTSVPAQITPGQSGSQSVSFSPGLLTCVMALVAGMLL